MLGSLHLPDIGATVRWTEAGEGRPLLYLPGLSMPVLPDFFAVAADPRLAGRRHILLDFPGSGFSDHPTGFDYGLEAQADVLARVIGHLGTGPLDIVGHSMGGTIAAQLAIARPELVARLVMAESNLVPGGGAMSLRIAGQRRDAFLNGGCTALLAELRGKARAGAAGPDRLCSGWRVADPAGIHGNAAALVDLAPDFLDRLAATPSPKTFIYGEQAFTAPPAPDAPDPERLAAAGIAHAVIAGAGHAMMLHNHDGFVEALAAALADA